MSLRTRIEQKLRAAFAPTHLETFDESHKHAGHAGNPDGGSETHIGIIIVSEKFAGLSRIDRSRAVHAAIVEEIKLFHALTLLKTLTPEEFTNPVGRDSGSTGSQA